MFGGYDGTIKIDSSINSKGFNQGIKGMINSLNGVAVAVGLAFGVGAVVAFGKSAVAAAAEIGSAFIGLQSIVEGQGKSFMGAKAFINDYIADGLVPAANAVTAYKNLLMRGYDTKQIETTMNALKNSAAFGRQASLSLGQAVQSATEGLKNENSILVDNAGVTKNVSMMWKDYAAAIGTTVGALTKEQKIEAEVQGILEETRFQMGDAAKLSGTYSGKISALGVSFTNLKVAVGNSIIPIINQVLPYIKMAVDALVIFFNKIAQIMNLLFGTNVSMADTASQMTDVAESTEDATDAQNDLADATTSATKAAKGALAAFDQLNVLQQDTGIGGAGEVSTAATAPVVLPPIEDTPIAEGLTALEEKVLSFKTKMMEFLQPVIDAFMRLKESLTPLGETIWAGLKWAWDNILVPMGAWVVNELVPAFLDLLAAGAELLNTALLALQPLWDWFWKNVLEPLAKWVGGKIADFIGWFVEKLELLSDWINKNPELFQKIILGFALIGIAILGVIAIVELIKAAFWGLGAFIVSILMKIILGQIMTFIMSVLTELGVFGTSIAAVLASPVLAVIALIAGIIAVIWLLIANWEQLSTTVSQIFFLLGVLLKGWWEMTKSVFFIALDAIEEKFITVFEGVKDFVKGIINGIIGFINSMIDSVVDGINTVINAANSIGGLIGGENFSPAATISAPQIPKLATGAVIPPNAQFAAILGDQKTGRNIEAPENLIRQIVREELQGAGGGEITVNMPVYLDSEKIYDGQQKVKTRRGSSLISDGVPA